MKRITNKGCHRTGRGGRARDYNIDRPKLEQFLTIQTAGRQVTCVVYNIELSVDAITDSHNLYLIVYPATETAQGSNGRGYKPLMRIRGSCSHQSKTKMEGQKDEDTGKKKGCWQVEKAATV